MSTERPRKGVTITRDRWGVPHIVGGRPPRTSRSAPAGRRPQDRQLIMELLRGPGRIAALDAPGRQRVLARARGQDVRPERSRPRRGSHQQFDLAPRSGRRGAAGVRIIDAYIAGINGAYRKAGLPLRRWTRHDVVAVGGLIGGLFGAGGGDETAALALPRHAAGRSSARELGRQVWEDLRLRDDPEARAAVDGTFAYGSHDLDELGNVVVDAAQLRPRADLAHARRRAARLGSMSNALLVGAKRSATGKPLARHGPAGRATTTREILLELDLHGGGYDARGAAFPGISFAILLGRGHRLRVERDVGGLRPRRPVRRDALRAEATSKYLYRGECRDDDDLRRRHDPRARRATPDQQLVFRETVHGPVIGYATVEGKRVAISTQALDARPRAARSRVLPRPLDEPRPLGEGVRPHVASTMEMTFNWLYADDRDIAQFTSGRLPRAARVGRPGAADEGHGRVRVAGLPAGRGARPGDRTRRAA